MSKDRQHIWCTDKGNDMDELGTYQPEDDGYVVACFRRGMQLIIRALDKFVG